MTIKQELKTMNMGATPILIRVKSRIYNNIMSLEHKKMNWRIKNMKKSVLKMLTVGLVFMAVLLVSSCVSFAAEDDVIDLGSIKIPIVSIGTILA